MENEHIVREFLFIDLTIKNLERDIKVIGTSALKIKSPYLKLNNQLLLTAIQKRRKIRKEMDSLNLRLEFQGKRHHYAYYTFYLNGYVKKVVYHQAVLKKHVAYTISQLLPLKD